MFCPQCGQQQVTGVIRFCSRCGFPLDGVIQLLSNGGALPAYRSASQMADRCYLEKCRNDLFHEFQACGLAAPGIPGGPVPIYKSGDDLLRKTPEFITSLFKERLDGYFRKSYKYMAVHFNGINPYMLAIEKHAEHLRRIVADDTIDQLRRRPRSINARALRNLLNVRLSVLRPRRRKSALPRHKLRVATRKLAQQPGTYLPT